MPDDFNWPPAAWKRWGEVCLTGRVGVDWDGIEPTEPPSLFGIPWHAPDPPGPSDNWAQPRDPRFLGFIGYERRFGRPLTLDEMKHNARLAGLLLCDCVWLDDRRVLWVPSCEVHGRCHACGQPRYHGAP